MNDRSSPRVLIIEENLPIARDLRVRRQSDALLALGFEVSVICPRDDASASSIPQGLRVHSYPAPPHLRGKVGYVLEYAYSWIMTAILAAKTFVELGFDAVQAGNPPDTYFALALPFKPLGKPFVFDQRDLSPELYQFRYGRSRGLLLALLRMLEKASYSTADHVIASNETFRHRALDRGRKKIDQVTIVGNGPELSRSRRRPPRIELKEGRRFLCCYMGMMGPQDTVELALRAAHHLVYDMGRKDCHFAFLGDGESFDYLLGLAEELGLSDWATFTGWVEQDAIFDYLSTADVGLEPNLLPQISTVKLMEYMAFELPAVTFDLEQTKVTAGGAAAYVAPNDSGAFADAIAALLDAPERRSAMGREGRRRIEESLAWEIQRTAYVDVFRRLLGDGDVEEQAAFLAPRPTD